MALFTISFQEGQIIKPTYDGGYSKSVFTNCGEIGQPRTITFNDTSGDFVVGLNWNNSGNNDLPADKITIFQYQDYTIEDNLQTGNQIILNAYAGKLRDSSTGLDLTYPYEISISQLSNIEQHHLAPELVCDHTNMSTYRYTRIRIISYGICDTAGHCGDSSSTVFMNKNNT